MVNFVPGAFLSLILPVAVTVAQISPFTAAPTPVALVLSAVTAPVTSSSATLPDAQFVPGAILSLNVVFFPLAHVIVLEVDVAEPVLLPEPPVFVVGAQVLKLSLATIVVAFALPVTLLQMIPVGVAPASVAVRAETPAIGTIEAAATAAPIKIRFLSTLVFSFI
jgi:hypothetical protein